MDALDLARWQFGITTVYHFIFVPLTIGLSLLVAIMQTIAVRAKDPVKADSWTRITKFFGSMLIVNFGIGIATGIVQEFQFGLNWSEYSRFVGDIFGAPLALEGLAAFFMESTFLGLWIFGWNRLPKGLHLLTIWMVAIGTTLSAYFIIAANSFMQHPVAAVFNPETGRAELDPAQGGIFALLTNITTLAAFPHVIAGAWLVAGCFVTGIAAWHMVKNHKRAEDQTLSGEEQAAAGHLAKNVWRPATRFGVLVMVLSAVGLLASGDFQGKLMFEQQPMKMASAEALCHTETGASFSILSVAGPRAFSQDCTDISHIIEIPYVTSILATNDPNATLKGVTELNAEYKEKFGATAVDASGKTVDVDYRPNLFVTYWSFRLMIGFAIFSGILAVWAFWVTRGKGEKARTSGSTWFARFALFAIPMPFIANAFGWIFTEMGRQPWIVAPSPTGDPLVRLLTMQGVSGHEGWQVIVSLVVFTLLYGVLAVVWYYLMRNQARKDIKAPRSLSVKESAAPAEIDTPTISFGY